MTIETSHRIRRAKSVPGRCRLGSADRVSRASPSVAVVVSCRGVERNYLVNFAVQHTHSNNVRRRRRYLDDAAAVDRHADALTRAADELTACTITTIDDDDDDCENCRSTYDTNQNEPSSTTNKMQCIACLWSSCMRAGTTTADR